MEAVLDIYKRVYNPINPVICFDESSKQQIQDLVDELPVRPGDVAKFDSEYQRNGVSNLFMIFEPLQGKRRVIITDRRTKVDWAECMKFVVDELYPDALKVTVVMDNLNTHKPKRDRWLARHPNVHFHYTPTRASWLNQIERWFGLITQQSIRRGSFRTVKELTQRIDAFVRHHNAHCSPFQWTATADSILRQLERLSKVICGTQH